MGKCGRTRQGTKGKGKMRPCTGTEALYRPCGPYGEKRNGPRRR